MGRAALIRFTTVACIGSMSPALAAQSIQVREVWSTTGSAGLHYFGAISGMAETGSGAIWVSDPLAKEIWAVDGNGSNLRRVARSGDGPGEVRAPSLLAPTPSGGIAVFDGGSIELFRRDGGFERRLQPQVRVVWPKGLAVLADWSVILSGGVFAGRSGTLFRIAEDGSITNEWIAAPETRNPMARVVVSGGAVSALPSGGFVFSRAAPHEILVFGADLSDRLFASDPAVLQPIGDDAVEVRGSGANRVQTFRGHFPQSRLVHRNRDGTVVNVVRNAEEDWSLWEWYESSGERIARVRLPRAYNPFTVCKNGDVLAYYLDPETDESVAARLAVTLRR